MASVLSTWGQGWRQGKLLEGRSNFGGSEGSSPGLGTVGKTLWWGSGDEAPEADTF